MIASEASLEPTGLPVSVNTLQKADRLIFGPLCFFLTVIRHASRERDSSESPNPRSLLFVKLAEQGSTVLATHAIRNATEWVGRENVYFLVFEENRFVLDVMELVPSMVKAPFVGIFSHTAFSTIRTSTRARCSLLSWKR
jgi:hypothetical protein